MRKSSETFTSFRLKFIHVRDGKKCGVTEPFKKSLKAKLTQQLSALYMLRKSSWSARSIKSEFQRPGSYVAFLPCRHGRGATYEPEKELMKFSYAIFAYVKTAKDKFCVRNRQQIHTWSRGKPFRCFL